MESQQNRHPLPTPPGQQQNPEYQQPQVSYQSTQPSHARPSRANKTRSRGFSFRSQGSSDKGHSDAIETHFEKEAKRLHSKADPTMAMNEAEPALIAAQARHTMGSLRMMEHTDKAGNVITDPDQSNPTRWRLERPLDTIRGFESAIRRNERSSMINTGGDNESVVSGWNPRNSYHGNGSRYQQQSYYGGEASRPQSGAFRADSYYEQQQPQQQGRWGPPQDRRRAPRMNSEMQSNQRAAGGNPYYDNRSYDAVASGSGTPGDPATSDNSSVERRQSPPKRQPEPVNDYGIGFSQAPEYTSSTFSVGGSQHGNQSGGGAPPPPRKDGPMLRKPVQDTQSTQDKQKKRRSFFGIGKGN